MIVEVDPETMMIEIRKYVVVHDCGTAINPLLVEGQIHGGVAQGIGNAFYEQLVFDDDGQLLNATLADFLIPTSLGRSTTRSPPRHATSLASRALAKPARYRSVRSSPKPWRTHSSCRPKASTLSRSRSARAGFGN
jgi:CO/xanthine dehydrogenase Mo-binding subunit